MSSLLLTMARALLSTLAATLLAALLVLGLVVVAGGVSAEQLSCLPVDPPRQHVARAYWLWLQSWTSPGNAISWSCDAMLAPLEAFGGSLKLLGLTLVFSGGMACLVVGLKSLLHWPFRGEMRLSASVLSAPPALWASVITVGFNLVLVSLTGGVVHDLWRDWYFPSRHPGQTAGAAVLALSLGAGTLWELTRGLELELVQLRRQDFYLVAKANGLRPWARVFRNLAVPFLSRLVSRIPLLVGEIIVVERLFLIPGVGEVLFTHLSRRDAHGLMTLTAAFVLTFQVLRGLVNLLAVWLMPPVKETEG